jgi:hypothetical protein
MKIYRWITPEKAHKILETGYLKPAWRHFVPEAGSFLDGISFSAKISKWRGCDHNICLMMDRDKVPSGTYEFDGDAVHHLTGRIQYTLDINGPRAALPLMNGAKKNKHEYTECCDEIFITKRLPVKHLCALVILDNEPQPYVDIERMADAISLPVFYGDKHNLNTLIQNLDTENSVNTMSCSPSR